MVVGSIGFQSPLRPRDGLCGVAVRAQPAVFLPMRNVFSRGVSLGCETAGSFAGRIAVIDDLQRLKQLHRAAVQVDDLKAFQRVLDAE